VIQVTELTKFYGAQCALNGLSFVLQPGEIAGLVGKNGAGKTTALRILSGQMLPGSGDALIAGHSVVRDPFEVRRRIGFLPEFPPLYNEMPVRSFLAFTARLRRVPAGRVGAAVARVVGLTDLEEVADAPVRTLSRGFRQRVGIAQAVIHEPPVVLLDEPMAGLDPVQIVHMRDLILGLRGRHTVLFSSHNLSEITQVCDRVILIDRGAVRAEGAEHELRARLYDRHRLRLVLRGTAAQARAVLARFPQATGEEDAGAEPGTVALRVAAGEDLREPLARACLEAGLGLLELTETQSGLEELFVHLLEGGPIPPRPEAPAP